MHSFVFFCFSGNYYLAYPIRKNSYLLEKIDLLIGRLHQAGLVTLWNNRTVMDLIYQRRKVSSRTQSHAGNKFVPFNLEDMQTSFYLLIVGLLLSSIVFCDEKGWLRLFVKDKKRQPIFYSKRKKDSFFEKLNFLRFCLPSKKNIKD